MRRKLTFLITSFFLLSFLASGQNSTVYNTRISADSIYCLPDSIWIETSSLRVENLTHKKMLSESDFSFDPLTHCFVWLKIHHNDSLFIQARIIPLKRNKRYFILDSSIRREALPPDYAMEGFEVRTNNDWWSTPGVHYSGNFSRGLSMGNNQSLVLNSALNLQMSGDLGDDIKILGAISDNQIPIQPEGNTKQVQEFDKLFIQISRRNVQLTAGDFELQKPLGYFMNYYKKTKGGLLETQHQLKSWSIKNKIAFAISKGKTQRTDLPTQNGNQGPYRLRGRDGESFIIILAGSEKVWIDGMLMVRGDDADYVMDYNLGEIIFTPRRIISNQSRVIIEFEYSVQNYTRTLSAFHLVAEKKSWQTYFNAFMEQDSRKPTVNSDLDSLDKKVLMQSGDQIELAIRSGIRKAGSDFNINRIYYAYKDTQFIYLSQTIPIQIIQYNSTPDSNSLQVGFSEVAKGNYRLKLSNSNGRVYEWIAPDPISGEGRGNYEPLLPIPAPQQNLLVSGGVQWTGKKEGRLHLESALSALDKNRLSPLQDHDNIGNSLRFVGKSNLIPVLSKNVNVQWEGKYEYNTKNFQALNPFRNAEFTRDWNVRNSNGFEDHLMTAAVHFAVKKNTRLLYENSRFYRSSGFQGNKHVGNIIFADSLHYVELKYDLLLSKDTAETARFFRPVVQFQRKFGSYFLFQNRFFREKNERMYSISDSLKSSSFYFDQFESSLAFDNRSHTQSKIKYVFRKDYLPEIQSFGAYSTVHELQLQSNLSKTKIGSLDVQLGGRKLDFTDSKLQDSLGRIYFLGLLDHQISFAKQAIRIKNYYELQSGAEPRQEFVFEEQRSGQGDYIYQDFNQDGIRQIQEYVYAPDIDTANFVRLQLFNSEYVQIYQNSWNQFIGIDLNRWIQSKKIVWKYFKKMSFESSFKFNNKVDYNSKVIDRLNPVIFAKGTSELISFQRYSQIHFFFNRANPLYEWQGTLLKSGQKNLLTSGTDERDIEELFTKMRITSFKKLDWTFLYSSKTEKRLAQNYDQQNYRLLSNKLELGLQYRILSDLRVQLNGSFKQTQETDYSKEKSKIWQGQLGLQSVLWKKLSVRGEYRFLQIDFSGKPGTAIEYVMLDGFKDGGNTTWDFLIDYKLSKAIVLQVSYTGRKAAASDGIHTGRAQLRANF